MHGSTADQRSDEQLAEGVRRGDAEAFGELWRRHSGSGRTVASRFTSSLDADDLVSEAFASIYQNTRSGGGPTGPFRPYLYTTIRNLACTWGRSRREVPVDDLAEVADPATLGDAALDQLDSNLTAQAFRALPTRWQTVLWYTEVEGMDPHEVAPLLGLTPNGVAALAYRAREGLRSSWLQAHVTEPTASGSCRWTIERLGDHTRRHLGKRDQARVDEHLAVCARCTAIMAEVNDVGARIAAILAPTLIGGGIGGGVFGAHLGHPLAATAAGAAPQLAAGSAPIMAGLGMPGVLGTSAGSASLFSGSAAAVSALLVAATVAGSALVGVTPVIPPRVDQQTSPYAASAQFPSSLTASVAGREPSPTSGLPSEDGVDLTVKQPDPTGIPGPMTPVTAPGAEDVTGAVGQVTPVAEDVAGGVTDSVRGVADAAVGSIDGFASGAVDGVAEVIDSVTGVAVPGVIGGVTDAATDVVGDVASALRLPPVGPVVASPPPVPSGSGSGGISLPLPGVGLPGVDLSNPIGTLG